MTYPFLEHGHRGLLMAYNNALNDYSTNADIANWDFENSSFKEISKEEALEMAKRKEADKLHLVIDGKIVTLKPDGRAARQDFSDFQISPDKVYTKRTGGVVRFTRLMPGSHLIKIADKIYLPTIVNKDRDIMKARDKHNKEIDDAIKNDTYFAINTSHQYPRGLSKSDNIKDKQAAARYALSMKNLQDSITSKQELLADAHQLEARRRKVLDDIEHLKQTGSRATQEAQKEYDDTVNYLRRLRKLIAKLELVLQGTSEDDTEALEVAKRKYDELVKQLDEYKDFTDELAAFKKKREGE